MVYFKAMKMYKLQLHATKVTLNKRLIKERKTDTRIPIL